MWKGKKHRQNCIKVIMVVLSCAMLVTMNVRSVEAKQMSVDSEQGEVSSATVKKKSFWDKVADFLGQLGSGVEDLYNSTPLNSLINEIDTYYDGLDDTTIIAYLPDGGYTQKMAFEYMYRLEYTEDYADTRKMITNALDASMSAFYAEQLAERIAVIDNMLMKEFKEYERKTDQNSFAISGDTITGQTSDEQSIFGDAWNQLDQILYHSGEPGTESSLGSEEKIDKWEKKISKLFASLGWGIYKMMRSWGIDVTVDGLVYGRMASTYSGIADFTHFGMEKNNPYGTIAATFYYVLRRIILSFLPIVFLILLITQLFKNTSKGRAQLKEMVSNSAVLIILLFAMPYLIYFAIYVKDAILKVTQFGAESIYEALGLQYQSMGTSIVMIFRKLYVDTPSFLNSLLLSASVGVGLFYLADYIRMAALLTLCVAVTPLVLLFSIWNRRILTDWFNVIIPNLLPQLLDLILLQIPAVVMLMYIKLTGQESGSVALAFILLIIMWSSIPLRMIVLKMFGFNGFAARTGMGALAMMAMRMGRAFRPDRAPSWNGSSQRESALETSLSENAAMENRRQSLMERAFHEPSSVLEDTGEYNFNPKLTSEVDDYVSSLSPEPSSAMTEGGLSGEMAEYDASSVSDGSDSVAAFTADAKNDTSVMAGDIESLPEMEDSLSAMDVAEQDVMQRENPILDFPEQYVPSIDAHPIRDEEFRSTLSDMDKNRYDNLANMDAYKQQIQENERTIKAVGYNHDTYSEDRNQMIGLRDNLDKAQMVAKRNMEAVDATANPDAYRAAQAVYNEGFQKYEAVRDRVSQLDRAHNLYLDNQTLRQRYQGTVVREEEAARVRAIGGMDSRRYNTANEFRYQTELDNIKRERANYRNFDTKQYEGILTPMERENFYREREKREKIRAMENLAARVAATGGTVTAAVAVGALAAYGGPSGMGMAGMAGSYAAERGLNRAFSGAGSLIRRMDSGNSYNGGYTREWNHDRAKEKPRTADVHSTNLPTGEERVTDPIAELLKYESMKK